MCNSSCKYSLSCGGCQIHGLPQNLYFERKLSILSDLLKSNLIHCNNILPIISCCLGIRRRAGLKIDFGNNIGFYKKSSNDVVPISHCQLLLPQINDLILPLKNLFQSFVKRSDGTIFISVVDNGICIDLLDINITPLDLPKIKDFSLQFNVIRVSDGKNVLFQSEQPFVSFNSFKIPFPINSFLQPSLQGQMAIVDSVRSFFPNNVQNLADLFCGLGLFSFNFIHNALNIFAFDCDVNAISNINKVSKSSHLNISAKAIDLFRKPLSSQKLDAFDLIILDPPRDGAKNQVLQIANSSSSHIIYVSCNPNSFVRDFLILQKAGFFINSIQPIDQFSYSNHLELVVDISR